MATELVADCPRCNSNKITFDMLTARSYQVLHDWQNWYECYCVCRNCQRGTIYILALSVNGNYKYIHSVGGLMGVKGAVNQYIENKGYISLKDEAAITPPEHLPNDVNAVFKEAATCLAVNCYNAAGTMFRLCIDLTTRSLLPNEDTPELNAKTRRDLGLRLPWLFAHGLLPPDLKELSLCVREDGNDGAHAGTLEQNDAEDLLDFTDALLKRIYTEPKRLALAKVRRDERRRGDRSR